jgi:hypothetical protein
MNQQTNAISYYERFSKIFVVPGYLQKEMWKRSFYFGVLYTS